MLIKSVTIQNYGVYQGRQRFDLTPKKDRNIILIGGKNGNGKTTFFEAIRFCLYGPAMFEQNITSTDYEKFLKRRIHKTNLVGTTSREVFLCVEFEHSTLSSVDNYKVERHWKNNGTSIEHQFQVLKNGRPLGEVESDQWQHFIVDLIPPGIAELFFFDGEKIQNLAEDKINTKQLADSFKSMLGIDLIEKLQSDLEYYRTKQLKKTGSTSLKKELENLEEEITKKQSVVEKNRQTLASLNSKRRRLNNSIDKAETNVRKEGGSFANKRDDLKRRKIELDTQIQHIDEEITKLCQNELPLVMAGRLNKELKKEIEKEDQDKHRKSFHKQSEKLLVKIKNELRKKKTWESLNLSPLQIKKVNEKIESITEKHIDHKDASNKLIHGLSSREASSILTLIDRSQKETPKLLIEFVKKQNNALADLGAIERELSFAPPDTAIESHIKSITNLHKDLGKIEEQIRKQDDELRSADFSLLETERKYKKALDDYENRQGLSSRIESAKKVRKVLESYHKKLTLVKAKAFEDMFLESYHSIARKKEVFSRVELNPETYELTLYRSVGNAEKEEKKSDLSAGEKQIYAVATLWALTKLSKKKLPFIIDTPLGRLDSNHRENLAKNFFPVASSQLIILSTDTEVDQQCFKLLEPHIARKYLLNHDEGMTSVREGYFWEKINATV